MRIFSASWPALLLAGLLASACKKEPEIRLQEVERQDSWREVPKLFGLLKVVLNLSHDAESLYMQQPSQLGKLSPLPGSGAYRQHAYVYWYSLSLPTELTLRLPMGPDFLARPALDSMVDVLSTTDPTGSGVRIRLRQLDPLATGIVPNFYLTDFDFGAINRNNYLLFGYQSANQAALRLVLSRVTRQAGTSTSLPGLQADSRVLAIPRRLVSAGSLIQWIAPIEDYFLVACGTEGVWRVQQDGTARRVLDLNNADTSFKWRGVLYLTANGQLLRSTDDGLTWQQYTATNLAFQFASFYPVGDSLVGVRHSAANQLFTLNLTSSGYRFRELKSDGISRTDIRDLALLGDTVYAGTLSGLFKRPLNQFFDSK